MYNYIATTAFGLEAVVKRNATKLGLNNISVEDGRVNFSGDLSDLVKANIHMRFCERILINLGEFKAYEFEDIFQGVKKIDWASILPIDANFIVNGKSVKSKLSSVPAVQSVSEKAIVEKLRETYKVDRFKKTGVTYKILIGILRDKITVSLDTSGDGLHKRGYREASGSAPLKETLAASLVDLSYWRPDRTLFDPVCGSGTILIEAAMMGKNIAPGLNRKFTAEDFEFIPKNLWAVARKEAFAQINHDYDVMFYGSDIDPDLIEIAKENALEAGVADNITFECKPFNEAKLPCDYGVAIMNPPYGERIGILEEVHQLYRDMGKLFRANDTWSVYVITSDEAFENYYGQKAHAKRKLFNGMIKTDYYQYHGRRPEKQDS